MIDTHVHLNLPQYDEDRDDVISRAVESGVTGMVNIGFDLPSIRATVELAGKHPFIYGALGFHPHDASRYDEAAEAEFLELLDGEKILAVGEIGLDYYRDLSPRDEQKRVFMRLLDVAAEKRKPVMIHCRDAFEDVIRVLEEHGGCSGVFHAFSGDEEMARKVLALGFRLGIGGVVTFKNSRLKEVIAKLPPESVVLETDCPYLTPHPFRGKRNEPANLPLIVSAVAEAQGVTPEDVVRTTDRTFAEIMGITLGDEPAVVYKIRNSLYINMTNRCTNRCVFCSREYDPVVRGYNLGLEREPGVDEMVEAVGDPGAYDEIVFCGYGEPAVRLPDLLETARRLKEKGARIRLNTNGLGNIHWKRNIVSELAGLIDVVSVSLNTSDPDQYVEICRPVFGAESFASLVDFIRKSVEAGMKTVCTAVKYPGVDIEACRKLAQSLGADFRAREYNVLG